MPDERPAVPPRQTQRSPDGHSGCKAPPRKSTVYTEESTWRVERRQAHPLDVLAALHGLCVLLQQEVGLAAGQARHSAVQVLQQMRLCALHLRSDSAYARSGGHCLS